MSSWQRLPRCNRPRPRRDDVIKHHSLFSERVKGNLMARGAGLLSVSRRPRLFEA